MTADSKWVGREPTPEMMSAAPASHSASFREIWPKMFGDIWRAMWDRAASPPAPGAEVVARVKPLVWHESRVPGWNGDWHTVPTGYTIRCADENGWKWTGLGGHGYALSPAAAKAEAQADHSRRILSALEPAPPTSEEIARRAREEALKAVRPLIEAAHGLSFGEDWNNGTQAKLHGYRAKLLAALPAALAALAKPPGETGAGE